MYVIISYFNELPLQGADQGYNLLRGHRGVRGDQGRQAGGHCTLWGTKRASGSIIPASGHTATIRPLGDVIALCTEAAVPGVQAGGVATPVPATQGQRGGDEVDLVHDIRGGEWDNTGRDDGVIVINFTHFLNSLGRLGDRLGNLGQLNVLKNKSYTCMLTFEGSHQSWQRKVQRGFIISQMVVTEDIHYAIVDIDELVHHEMSMCQEGCHADGDSQTRGDNPRADDDLLKTILKTYQFQLKVSSSPMMIDLMPSSNKSQLPHIVDSSSIYMIMMPRPMKGLRDAPPVIEFNRHLLLHKEDEPRCPNLQLKQDSSSNEETNVILYTRRKTIMY